MSYFDTLCKLRCAHETDIQPKHVCVFCCVAMFVDHISAIDKLVLVREFLSSDEENDIAHLLRTTYDHLWQQVKDRRVVSPRLYQSHS
jgi:hypothetical protein